MPSCECVDPRRHCEVVLVFAVSTVLQVSTFGGEQLQVKFGEISEAVLVFSVSAVQLRQSSEFEGLFAVMLEVFDHVNLLSLSGETASS